MLDQPQQVGACRRRRTADVVLRQAVPFPEPRLADHLQVAVPVCLRTSSVRREKSAEFTEPGGEIYVPRR